MPNKALNKVKQRGIETTLMHDCKVVLEREKKFAFTDYFRRISDIGYFGAIQANLARKWRMEMDGQGLSALV